MYIYIYIYIHVYYVYILVICTRHSLYKVATMSRLLKLRIENSIDD